MENSRGKRDPTYDIVKMIAMFMVIYWHVTSYRPGFDLAKMPSYVSNFIIAMNMPLFFMVSGYFSRRLHESGDWRRLAKRLFGYFWPLAFFGLFFTVIDCIVCNRISVGEIPLVAVKKFLFCGWFFYTLAACDVITFSSFRLGKSQKEILIGCVLGFLCSLLCSGKMWNAQQVVAMIPFYWFGLLIMPHFKGKIGRNPLVFIISVGVMAFVTFFAGNIATNGLSFYWNALDIFHPAIHDVILMISRYVVGICGSLFVIQIVMCIVKRMSLITIISFLGTETLSIYFLHGVIIRDITNEFMPLDASAYVIFVASCFVYTLSFIIVKITKINHIIRKVVWGKV